VEAHLTGIFPRSDQLVEATRAADRGKATQQDVDNAVHLDVRKLLDLQRTAGLDLLVDGQLNWQDLFRPFSELFFGIHPGRLARWFDNNTFYREPIVTDKVAFRGNGLRRYFQSQLVREQTGLKAILPGPFTFAVMSQNNAYQTLADLVDDLAHATKDTVAKLVSLGYRCVQFNDPQLCYKGSSQDAWVLARNAYDTCAKGAGAVTVLHTYFGDAGPVTGELLNFTVDYIGFDLYSTSLESVAQHDCDKGIGCGCVDGRNSLLESPEDIRSLISRVAEKLNPKDLFLCPNCDLEFLPYTVAEKKLQLLGSAKRLVSQQE